jgi:hypothetical protein
MTYDEEQAVAQRRYEQLRRRSVNPPYNAPKAPPPHFHGNDRPFRPDVCGICRQLQENALQEQPVRNPDRGGRER